MEKIEYKAPEMEVIKLTIKQALLIGSDPETPGGGEEW
jgi:hypothetical protein